MAEALLAGKPNKIIAADLGLSEHTIKMYMVRLMTKLGANNRTHACNILHARQRELENSLSAAGMPAVPPFEAAMSLLRHPDYTAGERRQLILALIS